MHKAENRWHIVDIQTPDLLDDLHGTKLKRREIAGHMSMNSCQGGLGRNYQISRKQSPPQLPSFGGRWDEDEFLGLTPEKDESLFPLLSQVVEATYIIQDHHHSSWPPQSLLLLISEMLPRNTHLGEHLHHLYSSFSSSSSESSSAAGTLETFLSSIKVNRVFPSSSFTSSSSSSESPRRQDMSVNPRRS